MEAKERLKQIRKDLDEGHASPTVTVREFIGWMDVQRRTNGNVAYIDVLLKESGLATEPSYLSDYIDSEIKFEKYEEMKISDSIQSDPDKNPLYHVRRLSAANKEKAGLKLVYVRGDNFGYGIITSMLINDYSQVPVVDDSNKPLGAGPIKGIHADREM